ncbi:AAA family ATPase [Schaalia sp. ZJ1691]|uniref:AAA family ATPase n=1 Tax=Schaalia sp. ZJ1691 TaxID=2709404 RepID=UPI00197DA4FC|nr:AAA family ATPase [Schaalia sp. ZJ1691]
MFQSLRKGAENAKLLPRVDAFQALYEWGVEPRRGQVIMVAGRSGSQKSGLALFWVANMGLPTLYFSADMSPFTAGIRLASIATGKTSAEVEALMSTTDGEAFLTEHVARLPIRLSFTSPITWRQVEDELNVYVLLHNRLPEVVVFDNLMDFEGGESDYTAQMQVMQDITGFARDYGVTVLVLHHASDKTADAKYSSWRPPSRDQVKNGMAEKPELTLGVALDAAKGEFNVACLKQRDGPSDPSADRFIVLACDPSRTLFAQKERPTV